MILLLGLGAGFIGSMGFLLCKVFMIHSVWTLIGGHYMEGFIVGGCHWVSRANRYIFGHKKNHDDFFPNFWSVQSLDKYLMKFFQPLSLTGGFIILLVLGIFRYFIVFVVLLCLLVILILLYYYGLPFLVHAYNDRYFSPQLLKDADVICSLMHLLRSGSLMPATLDLPETILEVKMHPRYSPATKVNFNFFQVKDDTGTSLFIVVTVKRQDWDQHSSLVDAATCFPEGKNTGKVHYALSQLVETVNCQFFVNLESENYTRIVFCGYDVGGSVAQALCARCYLKSNVKKRKVFTSIALGAVISGDTDFISFLNSSGCQLQNLILSRDFVPTIHYHEVKRESYLAKKLKEVAELNKPSLYVRSTSSENLKNILKKIPTSRAEARSNKKNVTETLPGTVWCLTSDGIKLLEQDSVTKQLNLRLGIAGDHHISCLFESPTFELTNFCNHIFYNYKKELTLSKHLRQPLLCEEVNLFQDSPKVSCSNPVMHGGKLRIEITIKGKFYDFTKISPHNIGIYELEDVLHIEVNDGSFEYEATSVADNIVVQPFPSKYFQIHISLTDLMIVVTKTTLTARSVKVIVVAFPNFQSSVGTCLVLQPTANGI